MKEELGTRILIPDKHWPQKIAQSYYIAVEALQQAGVALTDIRSSKPERVLMDPKAEFKQPLGEVNNNSIWGWSIDVTGDKEEVSG